MTDVTLNDGRTMPALSMGADRIPDAHVAVIDDADGRIGPDLRTF